MEIVEHENAAARRDHARESMPHVFDDIAEWLPRTPARVLVCGTPGSGKSALIYGLFKSRKYGLRRKYDDVHLIVPEPTYVSFSPTHPFKDHDKVYHEITSDLIDEIMSTCARRKEEDPSYRACIIIDDMQACLRNKEIETSLKRALTTSRHHNLTIYVLVQTFKGMTLDIRKLFNFMILFKPNSRAEFRSIFHEMLDITDKNDIRSLMRAVYKNRYDFMVIDQQLGGAPVVRRNWNVLEFRRGGEDFF